MPLPPKTPRAIHQFTPMLSAGDAVGNQLRVFRRLFREWGFASEIYADRWDARSSGEALEAKELPRVGNAHDVLLIHHSFESCRVPLFRKVRMRRAVAYHNVTPSRLFEGFEPPMAKACDAARRELRELAPLCERGFAFSRFSADELDAAGFASSSVIPFPIDWSSFDAPPDELRLRELRDGRPNILFVGRLVPNKAVDDVLRVFTAYQRLYSPRARLVVVGGVSWERPYGQWLSAVRSALGAENVLWLGKATQPELTACFETATAYLSMSRHEGFGVPLLEAMHRGVPVIAYGAGAIPETLGGAGICTLTRDPVEVAKLLAAVERDAELRSRIIEGQRRRMEALHPPRSEELLREALSVLWKSAEVPAAAKHGPRIIAPEFLAKVKGSRTELLTLAVVEALSARLEDGRGEARGGPEIYCMSTNARVAAPPGARVHPVLADEPWQPGTNAPCTALETAAAVAPELTVEIASEGEPRTVAKQLVRNERDIPSAVGAVLSALGHRTPHQRPPPQRSRHAR